MIVNVRGGSGSGKTHVVRELMNGGRPVSLYGVLGIKYPEAYRVSLPGVTQPLHIIGPYTTNVGGCDRLSYDKIIPLLEKYEKRGHVLFEGLLVSDNYGIIGEWLTKRGHNALIVFLDTSLAVCLERLRIRSGYDADLRKPLTTVAMRYETIKRAKAKFEKEAKVSLLEVSSTSAADQIHQWIIDNDR